MEQEHRKAHEEDLIELELHCFNCRDRRPGICGKVGDRDSEQWQYRGPPVPLLWVQQLDEYHQEADEHT